MDELTKQGPTPDLDCDNGRSRAQETAAELYQLAALMLGDETQAVEAVETAVARTEVDPCADAQASVNAARAHLVETALTRLSQAHPRAFDAPAPSATASSACIEGDDLSAAGVSAGQLESMVSGTASRTLRDWLNRLPAVQRIIFVQRAILGWDNAASAASFHKLVSAEWQPSQVGEVFRQALCSLASSLAHANAAHA